MSVEQKIVDALIEDNKVLRVQVELLKEDFLFYMPIRMYMWSSRMY